MGDFKDIEDDDPVEHGTMEDSLNRGLFSNPPYACEDQVENPVPAVSQQSGPDVWMGHGYNQGAPRPAVPNSIWDPDDPIIQPNQDAMENRIPNICGRPIGLGQELECHWPGCTTRVCRPCMNRNINDFWTLMESIWLAVCDDCKAFEGKRSRNEYVKRRCICVLNPPHFRHPGAQSQFCLAHTHARWHDVLVLARGEVWRRGQVTFNEPRLIKKKGNGTAKAGAARRAENQRRKNEVLATGHPLGVEVLSSDLVHVPRCPCGKKAGAGQHRAAMSGGGESNHARTNRRDEIRSCVSCYSHYNTATQQRDPRHVFYGALPMANSHGTPTPSIANPGRLSHPHGFAHAVTLNCPRDERTGWVRRGDGFW
ncbi:hypothetical protein FKW77_006515 [Venturia effusa]|uniref:Uncharacterized protein n=1 Tax=Venturia effusa TaxID=50376 RepID=A0A517LQA9_9PEZI|nr:hypothetical protein FKW77_006515 [Venturia effusa]